MRGVLAPLALAVAVSACGGAGEGRPLAGFAAPPPPLEPAPVDAPARGAIFQVAQGYAPLITGTRARALGDMVTIILTADARIPDHHQPQGRATPRSKAACRARSR